MWIIRYRIFKWIHLLSLRIGRLPWITIHTSYILCLPSSVNKSFLFLISLTKLNMVKKICLVLNMIDEYELVIVLYFIYLRGLFLLRWALSNFPL